jgi:D-serine deaminase-like pyridoxal phosphate-dependent protein
LVLPVHSCLTANLFGGYLTLAGERISLMPKDYQAT